jgi:mitochondrial import inner membrane translocase subunit TIM54
VGSWSGAVLYDRREKKRLQAQWCAAVSHLAREPLLPSAMPRRLRVVLAATPGDSLVAAREHFYAYARPVLLAAGVDWEAVEGRVEGDVRALVAEGVRVWRAGKGEGVVDVGEEEERRHIREFRQRNGVKEEELPAGDIVFGRNTWKEYVRGLHEGWLGPLRNPAPVLDQQSQDSGVGVDDGKVTSEASPVGDGPRPASEGTTGISTGTSDSLLSESSPKLESQDLLGGDPGILSELETIHGNDDLESQSKSDAQPPPPDSEKKKPESEKKRPRPPPFIDTKSYSDASLPPSIPNTLGPSAAVPYPVIFGFRNTPIRMWRFLNQRHDADQVGRQVAAAILASYTQYQQVERPVYDDVDSPTASSKGSALCWEQEDVLQDEEWGWQKSFRKRDEKEPEKERVWLDPVVVDSRIASRMVKFVVPEDGEAGRQE